MRKLILAFVFLSLLNTLTCSAEESPTEGKTGPVLRASSGNGSGPGSLLGSSDTLLFTGSFTHTISFEVPPGTHGLQPNLALSYNSSNSNGWCGVGWDLSFGIIQRSTKNGIPKYNNTDTFIFSSQELTSIGSNEYRVKIDSGFMKIVFDPNNNTWTAYDKSGTRYIFGHGWGESATVVKPNTADVFSWSLSSIIDTDNNEIYFGYTHDQNQIYLSWIEYSHHGSETPPMRKIVFNLEDRMDQNISYRAGFSIKTAKRLKSIETKLSNTLVKKYELNYINHPSTQHSLLTEVKVYGKNETLFPNSTAFSYHMNENPGLETEALWCDAGTDNDFYLADFNGDGKMDLANHISEKKGLNVWFSNGTIFVPQGAWLDSSVSTEYYYFYIYDFTGDGLVDVGYIDYEMIGSIKNYRFRVCANTGNGLQILPTPWMTWSGPIPKFQFGDCNGDGKVDLVWPDGQSLYIFFANEAGNAFYESNPAGWYFPDTEGSFFLFDLNGDGKTDVARRIISNDQEQRGLHVWFKTKDGFEDKGIWLNDTIDTYKIYFADFNSDGLLDVCQHNYKGDKKIEFYLNNSNNFTQAWKMDEVSEGKDLFFADFNGDGLVDLAKNITQSADSSGYGGLLVYFNTGTNFFYIPLLPQFGAIWTEAGTGKRNFQLYDFNGDGKTEVGYYDRENPDGTASGMYVKLNRGKIANLLSQVNNSLGGTTGITYISSANNEINTYLPFPIQVVDTVINNDGLEVVANEVHVSTITYTYKNGLYDLKAKEFLGFGEVQATDEAGNYTITEFEQTVGQIVEINGDDKTYVNPYKGKIASQESYNSGATLLAKTNSTYDYVKPISDKNWYFPRLRQTDSYTYNGGVEKHTWAMFHYDSYGNVTEADNFGDYSTNTDDVINLTEYAYNINAYLVGYPFHQITRDYNLVPRAESWIYYDGAATPSTPPVKGNVTKKAQWLQGGNNPIVTMEYDSYGNVIKVEDANYNADNSKGNVITTVYDSVYHTFPVEVTNILNHIQKSTYDPGTGNVLTETAINGQTTTNEYDTFGRLLKVYSPIDNTDSPSIIYSYNDTTLPRSVHIQSKEEGQATGDTATTAKYLDTWQFYDGLGRIAQTQSQNTTKWSYHIISDVKTYNSRGLVDKSYTPFLPDHQTYIGWVAGQFYENVPTVPYYATTSYTYDALGRVIRQELSDGTFSTVSFSGWNETRTDPKGKSIVYEKDAYGRIIQVTEHNNGQDYLTKYTYDTLGNLKTITNALSETTTINYDSLGRKINMNDPKMGYWEYNYDANGNLISQKDAKGQTTNQLTTLIYDRLNRIVSKVYPPGGGQIDYAYDTGDNGIGRLAKVTDLSGYTEFTYDKLGRVTSTKKNITVGNHPKNYSTGSEYNASGQQTKLSYPNSKEISYGYNSSGNLLTVGDTATDFVKQTEYNQNGQIIQMDFNNDLTTAYEYNWNNLRLTKLITGNTFGFTFTDPTYISYNRKDHTAFNEFMNKLEGVSK